MTEPKPAELRTLFDQYKDDLPRARSATPGFREPARIRYDAVVAPARAVRRGSQEGRDRRADRAFYEENKDRLFKAVEEAGPGAAEEPAADSSEEPGPEQPSEPPKEDEEPAEPATEPAAPEQPADEAAEGDRTDAEGPGEAPQTAPASEARVNTAGVVQTASFRQPGDAAADADPPAQADADAAGDSADEPAGEPRPASLPRSRPRNRAMRGLLPPSRRATSKTPLRPPTTMPQRLATSRSRRSGRRSVEQLARQAADERISERFDKVAAVIARHAEDCRGGDRVRASPCRPPPTSRSWRPSTASRRCSRALWTPRRRSLPAGSARAWPWRSRSSWACVSRPGLALMFGEGASLWRPVDTTRHAGQPVSLLEDRRPPRVHARPSRTCKPRSSGSGG